MKNNIRKITVTWKNQKNKQTIEKQIKNNKITWTEYNNKSRKGTYIKLKIKNKTRTYKYNKQKPIEEYIKQAKKSYKQTQKTKGKRPTKTKYKTTKKYTQTIIKQRKKQWRTYLKKHGGTIKIKDAFNKGAIIKTYSLETIYNNPKKIAKEMLKPLILDNQLLNIMTEPQNLQKVKHKFWYWTDINGRNLIKETNEETILQIEDNQKTPQEYTQNYKKRLEYEKGQIINQKLGNIIIGELKTKNKSRNYMYGSDNYETTKIYVKIEFRVE